MLRLLKIDIRKYISSKTFWVLLAMFLGLIWIILVSTEGFLNSLVISANNNSPITFQDFSIYSFPNTWHMLTYLAGVDVIKLFLSFLIIIFVTNEFTNKTIRQNVMNGLSRKGFLFSKVIFVSILSLLATLVVAVNGFIIGSNHTENVEFNLMFEKIHFLPAYFLEMFTYSAFVLLLAFIIKRPVLAVGTLIIYYFSEWFLSTQLPENIAGFLPFETMGNIIDRPNTKFVESFGVSFRETISVPDVFTCFVYSFVFIGIIYLLLRRSDI